MDVHALNSYLYTFPQELIAKHPCTPRDAARLMVINRLSGEISEMRFRDLVDFLAAGDSLVLNDARVVPARLLGRRETGGVTEILLVRRLEPEVWEAIGRPGRKLRKGSVVRFHERLSCEILSELEGPKRLVRLVADGDLEQLLNEHGQLPLPLYMRRPFDSSRDLTDYQTVFATQAGSVAAPTAALHFSQDMLRELGERSIKTTFVTLDISLGTFQPVLADDIRLHEMHRERYFIRPETSDALNHRIAGKRQVCVGTTSCRVLESAFHKRFQPGYDETGIFIYPGYQFHYVESLLTNFHTPGSTLLMLVCAFAGYELIMEAYAKAIERRFRLFSYGDAMLII